MINREIWFWKEEQKKSKLRKKYKHRKVHSFKNWPESHLSGFLTKKFILVPSQVIKKEELSW